LIVSRADTTYNSIEIEFHDKSSHRPFHFTDHYSFTIADLGELFFFLNLKNFF